MEEKVDGRGGLRDGGKRYLRAGRIGRNEVYAGCMRQA